MTASRPTGRSLTRRRLLVGAAGVGGVAAVAGVGYAMAPQSLKNKIEGEFGVAPEPYIPDAPEGRVKLETRHSEKRGRDVGFFTAVPDGYGDGAGLPVVVILHGGSATTADYQEFGFGRFLTQAVLDGSEPFVLAGADGGQLRWEPGHVAGDDPQAMVVEEIPAWLAQRGFDADRRALWGWSMGGYGSLRLAEAYPQWSRAVAAFSPAMNADDPVFDDVAALALQPLAIWCGTEDSLYDTIQDFVEELPEEPEIVSYSEGAHTRIFWNDQTLEAFDFLSGHLAAGG
jgi:pimeloyl-ACP methyl ester carboxylesterase